MSLALHNFREVLVWQSVNNVNLIDVYDWRSRESERGVMIREKKKDAVIVQAKHFSAALKRLCGLALSNHRQREPQLTSRTILKKILMRKSDVSKKRKRVSLSQQCLCKCQCVSWWPSCVKYDWWWWFLNCFPLFDGSCANVKVTPVEIESFMNAMSIRRNKSVHSIQ